MSWTDLEATRTFGQLAKEFEIQKLIETGTFRAQGARTMSSVFDQVLTCEVKDSYYWDSCCKTLNIPNVKVFHQDSSKFLSFISLAYSQPLFYYLDAHFYNPDLPKEDRFTVKKELQAIFPTSNCIIAIHDFDTRNGLGHLVYDGIPLDFDIVKEELKWINPDFVFYTNYKEACQIVTAHDLVQGKLSHMQLDKENQDSISFIWSHPFKTYRGILYCIPREVDLTQYKLHKVDWI